MHALSLHSWGGENAKTPPSCRQLLPFPLLLSGTSNGGLELGTFFFYLDIEAKPNIQIQLDHLVRRGKEQTEHGWPVLAL